MNQVPVNLNVEEGEVVSTNKKSGSPLFSNKIFVLVATLVFGLIFVAVIATKSETLASVQRNLQVTDSCDWVYCNYCDDVKTCEDCLDWTNDGTCSEGFTVTKTITEYCKGIIPNYTCN